MVPAGTFISSLEVLLGGIDANWIEMVAQIDGELLCSAPLILDISTKQQCRYLAGCGSRKSFIHPTKFYHYPE